MPDPIQSWLMMQWQNDFLPQQTTNPPMTSGASLGYPAFNLPSFSGSNAGTGTTAPGVSSGGLNAGTATGTAADITKTISDTIASLGGQGQTPTLPTTPTNNPAKMPVPTDETDEWFENYVRHTTRNGVKGSYQWLPIPGAPGASPAAPTWVPDQPQSSVTTPAQTSPRPPMSETDQMIYDWMRLNPPVPAKDYFPRTYNLFPSAKPKDYEPGMVHATLL